MPAPTTVACARGRGCRGKPSAQDVHAEANPLLKTSMRAEATLLLKAYMHAEASLLLMTSMRAKATLLLKAMQRQAFCSNLERVYAIGVVVLGLSLSARSTSLLHTSLAFCFLYAKPMSTLSPIRGNNLNLWSQK